MGGQPYWYVVDFEEPLQNALDTLRKREFEAGRYYPVTFTPSEDPNATPGAQHATIQDALDASGAEGTRSILDIKRIAAEPTYCVAAPLRDDELTRIYGTTTPPSAQLTEHTSEILRRVERGMARYVIGYDDGRPTTILFAGYSFD